MPSTIAGATTRSISASPWKIILPTGLLAGTMDGLAASIQYYLTTGNNPAIVFRYIASGVLGRSALAGGTGTALLGVGLHYMFAFIFTIIFVWAYPGLRLQRFNKFLVGIVYALIVWCCMNLVVVPITFSSGLHFQLQTASLAALILIICIGMPISLMTHWWYERRVNS